MSPMESDASGYGSLGAFSAIHRPTRRKKILFIIAAASILLCAALVSVGKSRFLGTSLTELSSDLPVHEPEVKPSISSHSLNAQHSSVENWGNQTPSAMIYARHNPIRDGVVDFYLNFPVGSSRLRAPKWFMGIPLRRKSAKSLKQVELAILEGQINRFPTAKAASSSNRKLLQKTFGAKKALHPSPAARKVIAKGAVSIMNGQIKRFPAAINAANAAQRRLLGALGALAKVAAKGAKGLAKKAVKVAKKEIKKEIKNQIEEKKEDLKSQAEDLKKNGLSNVMGAIKGAIKGTPEDAEENLDDDPDSSDTSPSQSRSRRSALKKGKISSRRLKGVEPSKGKAQKFQNKATSSSKRAQSSRSASLKENCCLPACARGKLPNEFSPKGCSPCSNPAEKKQCESVLKSAECKKLAGNRPIKKGDIFKPLFSAKVCSPGSSSSSSRSSPSTPPVPVPSCAIDKSGKFAGCASCLDHKQFPAVDGRECNSQLQKFKPVVGVTVVTRSDKLPDPNPPKPQPGSSSTSSPKSSTPSSSYASSSKSSKRPPPKMCSHDPTKLNGNGKGCATCQAKAMNPARSDPSKKGFLPGNDYWACEQCRSKGICNIDCVLNSVNKVWECAPPGTPSVKEPEPSRPTPTCSADPKIRWGDSFSNEMQCQGHMCKTAGILPSGEYGTLKYPTLNAYPKKMDAKTCCPFVAQGLSPASCYTKFGCEVPFAIEKGKRTWELSDSVQLCKNFFCRLSVTSPAVWAQKKGDSVFAQGINKGRSACCEKLLASTPDGKESWCPAAPPPVSPIDDITPVIKMTDDDCKDFLCMQAPKISDVGATYAVWREHFFEKEKSEGRRLLAVPPAPASSSAKSSASRSAGSKSHDEAHDPSVNVPICVNQLQLSGTETWETNQHCAQPDTDPDGEVEHEEEKHGGEEPKGEEHTGEGEEHKGEGGHGEGEEHKEEEHSGEAEHEPELEKEELPEAECDEENGPESLQLLPGANVLGYTYDPDLGLAGCNFDRCVIRPFIKFTYKECKVVETPAGMFKVPDQIFAYNLYETSAKTHVYENEKEQRKSQSVDAHIEGSYMGVSASATASHSGSSESSSKQHIAVRKIDVHLYRLNLVNRKSFNDLVPEFQEAFKALPPRFEQNVHAYIQFLKDWGRFVPVSGTFGGSVEVIMKFFSASSASKEEMSVGVEAAYASATVSVSGGVNYGKSNEAKEVENNNEISLESSGGDPAIGAMISDIHAPEQMNFREDLQEWLHSLPKYPRLVEDWPILSVMTNFIPNSPGEDGFDPFTRNQGVLDAMRILAEDGATSLFAMRKCLPPLPPPDVKELGGPSHIPAPKVRIFQHCNFGGVSLALAPGDFDSSYLQNPGGYDFVQQISSLQIDKGFTVILFSRPGFQGETLVLDKGSSCLVGQNFNDKAQSMKIIGGKGEIKAVGKPTATLYNGRTSLQFNDFDRFQVGQCITFIAETDGDIDIYMFSSPTNQLSAYGFHVKTTGVTFERGLFKSNVVLKKSTDANAAAFGQSSLAQKVWFCAFKDAEDASATVFQYGRDSSTLFEYVERSPVNINYFAMDCSKAATYRSIIVIAASRWLEYTNPYNKVCAIINCEEVQETESESGTCACKQCAHGYEPYNNNEECIVASQCPAQFGCLAATPPKCICEECCCGLSFDPVSLNCVNANMMIRPGTTIEDNIFVASMASSSNQGHSSYGPIAATRASAATTLMETKFKTGSSYRIKKLSLACTQTNLQNIRVSYDESKPALGFIDYDSTHLVTSSDIAGKFDFSIYDNLRKSVKANPLFSTSGFLNLDEIKLEEVTVKSMIKKSGGIMKDLFKFVGEGAKQFAKDVDATLKKGQQLVEDVKNKAVEVANDLKAKANELVKVADEEAKKFMKNAQKVYNDVATVAQEVSQGAVNLIADNAGLLKTLNGIGGAVAGSLMTTLPQLLSLTGVCAVWCGAVISAVGNAAIAASAATTDGLINMAVSSKESGQNPLAFLKNMDIPADIKDKALPILNKGMAGVNMDDIKKFANSDAQGKILDAVTKDGFSAMKDVFNDPGLQALGNGLIGDVGAQLIGKLPVDQLAETGIKALSPMLDKVLPGAGSILGAASKTFLPGFKNMLGGLFGKKRSLLSENDDLTGDTGGRHLLWNPFKDLSKMGENLASKANEGLKNVQKVVNKAGEAIKSAATDTIDKIGDVHKNVAGHLDKALGTTMFSEASNAVHEHVGGRIKGAINGVVDSVTGAISKGIDTVTAHIESVLDPNKSKREYMNSQEYKDKMAAKAIFQTFTTKLGLPTNMPKYLTDSIVQFIIGEMKVTPINKQPFLTNLNAENQCVSAASPETCTEGDIKCIVLAKKCFLDDEECIKAALATVPTIFLEKYAAANRLDFPGSSYGRYIRISAPNCKKRASSLSQTGSKRMLLQSEGTESEHAEAESESVSEPVQDNEDTTVDEKALFAEQPKLVFGLTSKFWKQPQLISLDANTEEKMEAGRRLSRGMRLQSPDGQCRAEVQMDGNFVIYKGANQAIWNTNTKDIFVLFLKPDGNLCAYRADGSIAWGCGTSGSNAYLAMQNDCNLVLYKDGGKGVAWDSGTVQNGRKLLFFKIRSIAAMLQQAVQKAVRSISAGAVLSDLRGTLFQNIKPDFQGQVSNLNFPSTDKAFAGSPFSSEFLAQFSGNIFVPITGTWTFFLSSDDGSRLYVDGSQLVDNDGFHGMKEVSGSVVLSRGMHSIDISFFQGGGGAGLTLEWSGPSTAKQIIPKEFFLLNSKDVPLSLPREQGCQLDNNLQISQIAVFDPFGTNMALNKPCDTSNPLISDKLVPYLPSGPQNVFPSTTSCSRAVDGNLVNRDGNEIFQSSEPDSDTVTIDLGQNVLIKRIMYWNRKDCCQNMIAGATLEILNENGEVVNTEVFTNKLIQAFNFPASQSRATLFTECNYGGEQVVMGPGSYKLAMMQIPKASLSSIKLPNDLEIKLFVGENFDGESTPWIQADVPCLNGFKFNDQTGSLQVRERSKLNSMNSNEVIFYDNCDFRGVSMTLNPGDYTAAQLQMPRNSIMSVKVPAELEVQLYSFDNLGGRSSGWLQRSSTCLTDIDFSRTTVSLQIRKRTKAKKRGLLSDVEEHRTQLISMIAPHAGRYAFYMPKNGDSEEAKKTLRLAFEIAHHGAHAIAQSHQQYSEMLASISKWVPYQYVLSALKMDLEQNSATSAFAHPAIDRAQSSLFTRLNEIADGAALMSLNLLDQTVVDMLGSAYAPVTLPGPCFSRDLIMSYLPANLQSGIDNWVEMEKFSWIQEIRVDSVDSLLRDSKVVQADKYAISGLSFKISQYNRAGDDSNAFYSLVRGIETRYQKFPSFGGPGDTINAFIGKAVPDGEDKVPITDCTAVNFDEGEFLISMAVVILPEGLAGIDVVQTNKRSIPVKCGQKPSRETDADSDDGVVWLNCDTGSDAIGVGGKFDSRVMRTLELKCSPTSQADRVQFLGVYSYSFVTNDFFNGISGAPGSGYRAGFWGAGSELGITRKADVKPPSPIGNKRALLSENGDENADSTGDTNGRHLLFDLSGIANVANAFIPGSGNLLNSLNPKANEVKQNEAAAASAVAAASAAAAANAAAAAAALTPDNSGWVLRIWTNRVPPISPVTGKAPVGVKTSSLSPSEYQTRLTDYGQISDSNSLTKAMAPPGEARYMFDSSQVVYTDIVQLTFAEDTSDGSIRGVYVHYSARPDLYSGFVLNPDTSYKHLRMKNLNLQRNEYWTGLKVGLDPATGAVSCITGVKSSLREYGILCGSRDATCLKKAGWMECPSDAPLMVALQEDFNNLNQLIGLMPICASMKATRFQVNELTVQFEEDEFMNALYVRSGDWLDAVTKINTNKRTIPLQCGLVTGGGVSIISLPTQFTDKTVKKGRAVIGFKAHIATNDQFGVFADTSAISVLSDLQKKVNKEKAGTEDQILKMQQSSGKTRGPGPTMVSLALQALTYDSDPQSAFIMEAPEEAGRSRIPDFEDSGVYVQPTFDMAFDFFKPRVGQFMQILSVEFQCNRAKSTAKEFWMPWLQMSFTDGSKFSQGEKSTGRLAVSKSLKLSAEEYMTRIELSSNKDRGYTITAVKTNKKHYNFKCGALAVALDVPVQAGGAQKDLIIGFAGNVQTSVDGAFFANLQALHLRLNAFASEPSQLVVNQ